MPELDITRLLLQADAGDLEAGEQVFAAIYDELKRVARFQRGRWRQDEVLNATALVNEAWLKLSQGVERDWQNQGHFFAVAARAMRQILVDNARQRHAVKRGGDCERLDQDQTLADREGLSTEAAADILGLHETLERLEKTHPRQARVVEYRFFGGLQFTEISQVLGVSLSTVRRDWELAKIWLQGALSDLPR